jgi:trans-aconitate methyltransferase
MGTPLDVADLLTRAGLVDVTCASAGVCLEVPDAETYWDWTLTHGMRAFVDDLPADRRAEFREAVLTRAQQATGHHAASSGRRVDGAAHALRRTSALAVSRYWSTW